jgi:hypothetical protein
MQIVAGSAERHSFSCAKGWVVEARLPTRSFHSTLRLANVTRHLLSLVGKRKKDTYTTVTWRQMNTVAS